MPSRNTEWMDAAKKCSLILCVNDNAVSPNGPIIGVLSIYDPLFRAQFATEVYSGRVFHKILTQIRMLLSTRSSSLQVSDGIHSYNTVANSLQS